jgi:hypothetical protein
VQESSAHLPVKQQQEKQPLDGLCYSVSNSVCGNFNKVLRCLQMLETGINTSISSYTYVPVVSMNLTICGACMSLDMD